MTIEFTPFQIAPNPHRTLSCQGAVLIRKDLIIAKQRLDGDTEREAVALGVDIDLSDSSKRGSPLSELPCQAGPGHFWEAGGPGDKRPHCYLCVKGHTGLAKEAKATTICVSRTHSAVAIYTENRRTKPS